MLGDAAPMLEPLVKLRSAAAEDFLRYLRTLEARTAEDGSSPAQVGPSRPSRAPRVVPFEPLRDEEEARARERARSRPRAHGYRLLPQRIRPTRDVMLLDRQLAHLKAVKTGAKFTGDIIAKFSPVTVRRTWDGTKTGLDVTEKSGERGLDPKSPRTWNTPALAGGVGEVALNKVVTSAIDKRLPDLPQVRGRLVVHGSTLLSQPPNRIGHAVGLATVDKLKSDTAWLIVGSGLQVLGEPAPLGGERIWVASHRLGSTP